MEAGAVRQADIDQIMRSSYLDYAMSVIVSRALPDARDGLKPVHRRILYAMYDMGLRPPASYKKSARIVGEVLGKYHPHGDSAVYEAMARMAQSFSMRYPLIDGQGNFGSIDGDLPAAMRYTEARLARISEEMLADIHKDTVDFEANFDDSLREPGVLPSRLPNLLLNGSSGIAVGMATNIAPHNVSEICDAIAYLVERYAEIDEVTPEDLMQLVQGPDFPTGGLIVGQDGIVSAYLTGRGQITVRAVTHVEETKGTRHRIVITELPYQVNKANLLERIAELVRDNRIEDVIDLRDESDRRGMSIIIELKRGAQPHRVLKQLFRHTQLQTTFGYNCLALVDGTPRTLSLKQVLQIYIEHRQQVIARRSRFDLERARSRAHVLDGLCIAMDRLDAVIQTIRESPDADAARARLLERFDLTDPQAQAILDMQLRRLSTLERQKLEEERAEVVQAIADLEDLLANPDKILHLVRQDVDDLKLKYGDARRTHIVREANGSLEMYDLVPDVQVLISITRQGYIMRTPTQSLHLADQEKSRMVGVKGIETHQEDSVTCILAAGSRCSALFFSDKGKVYQEKVYQIPEGERSTRGIPLRSLIRLEEGERVTAALPVSDWNERLYLMMFTAQGKAKRVPLSDFAAVRANGLLAFSLDAGDELGWVLLTDGQREVILTTAYGKSLRFSETQVRPQSRTSSGVLGIRLAEGDRVACVDVVQMPGDLLVATQNGFGKRTDLSEYPVKGRNTGGVVTLRPRYLEQTGPVVAALVVQPHDAVTLITANGMALRTDTAQIPRAARGTRGQIVMNVYKGDRLAAVARLIAAAMEQEKE